MEKGNLKKMFLIVLAMSSIMVFAVLVMSTQSQSGIRIHKGENNLSFNVSSSFHVKDFVKLNPEIEVVSYKGTGNVTGYVNVFGGIGEDFYIENNTQYEIYSSGNSTLIFP